MALTRFSRRQIAAAFLKTVLKPFQECWHFLESWNTVYALWRVPPSRRVVAMLLGKLNRRDGPRRAIVRTTPRAAAPLRAAVCWRSMWSNRRE